MSEALAAAVPARPRLDTRPHISGAIIFIILLGVGIGFVLNGIISDIDAAHTPPVAIGAFVLLGIALLIALGFEFVNGFHDTVNAVATVIYTHSLPPHVAVIWSGAFNFLGVMVSSGEVAFSVLSLLPVELILQVGGSAGFAMIFALLIAAIVWNLGTWWLGLPASSSHTMIGSIIGVGLANQLMAPAGSATSGVDWSQAMGVFRALLFSPVAGFVLSAVLLVVLKAVIRNKTLYSAPTTDKPTLTPEAARAAVTAAIQARQVVGPQTWAGLAALTGDIATQVRRNGEIAQIPAAAVPNVRNDMYLASEAIRLAQKTSLSPEEASVLGAYRKAIDNATKFIPTWVKIAVAIALGLGTMIGWKRIVVTAGEKIGKSHLTYGQGAAAEMVAAVTIGGADMFGLPVSTTYVLSSGVAGTMLANGSGLQWSTVRSIALAWVLTLPAAMLLSGVLYFLLRQIA